MKTGTGHNRALVVRALRAALAADDARTRCQAVRAFARLGVHDSAARKTLTGLLLDPDGDVRMEAAQALGRLRIRESIGALVDNLRNDPEGGVRIEAVKALGQIGSRAAVQPLIDCFKAEGYPELDRLSGSMEYGPWFEVQSRALDALGEIGDARAIAPVIQALENDDYEDMQEQGFRVLAQLDGPRARDFLIGQLKSGKPLARRRAARALATLHGKGKGLPPELLKPLLNALTDPDPGVRIAAAQALAGSGSPLAVVPFTLLLGDPEHEVRKEVAALFAGMRGKAVLDRLHALLAGPDPALGRRVAQVLGDIGDAASVAPLSAALEAADRDLVYEAVGALGRIGARGPEQSLAGILANEELHYTTRVQAAAALGRILATMPKPGKRKKPAGDVRPLTPQQVLARAVHDPDERVSHAALRALVETDPKGATAMLGALVRGTAGGSAVPPRPQPAHGGEPRATAPELNELIAGHNPRTSTLAAILASEAQRNPAPQTQAPQPQPGGAPANSTRILAARLLGDLVRPGPRAVTALKKACETGDAGLRREAILALGRIGGRRGLATIAKGLDAAEREVRLAALDALSGLRNAPRLGPRLTALCRDPDAGVRAQALRALAAAGGESAAEVQCRALDDEHPDVCRAALAALSKGTYTRECREAIVNLMFRHGGELRAEAAATLRRLNDYAAADRLLDTITDRDQEDIHWICLEALAALHAKRPTNADTRRSR